MAEFIVPRKTYIFTFVGLILLAGLTTALAFVDLGPFSFPVALLIAVAKMLLVALFFMHLRYGEHLAWVVAICALIWFGILLSWTIGDYMTRGWLPFPGE